MVRNCAQVLLTLIFVYALIGMATPGFAEIRSKPAGTGPRKSRPGQSTPVREGTGPGTRAKPADGSRGSDEDAPLADDDSPKGKPNSKATKDNRKKKDAQKGQKGSKSSAANRSGRPPKVEGSPDQQGLVGTDLNLDPET